MNYRGSVGTSPLDGLVNLIDGLRHGSRDAKRRAKDLASAPKRKIKETVSKVRPKVQCGSAYHNGKRGKTCDRCGSRIF